MSERRPTHAALILESAEEESLWLGAFASQGMPAAALAIEGDLERLAADERIRHARGVIVDAPVLCARGFAADAFAAFLMQRYPGIAVFVRLPSRTGISAAEQAWARHAGIASLLPGSSVAAWQDSLAPVLSRVLAMIGRPKLDAVKIEAYLHELMRSGTEPRPGPVKDAYVAAFELERAGVNAGRLHEAMLGEAGVAVADRTWRGRTYRDCFVASQAIDWLVARYGLDRGTALRTLAFLWRTGRIHHVLRDAELHDDYLYFRFSGRRADLDRVDLVQLEAAMRSRGGVPIAERVHLSKSYPRCFVGEEAVDWIMARCGVPLGTAECVGQRLLELGVFHHVLDEHGFVAGRYFYRFRADETALA
jgi:hypothetical protein